MNTSKFIIAFLLSINSMLSYGQASISKYSLNLLSDTTIQDTIKINLSYYDCFGEHKGFIRLERVDTNYLVQVFWQRIVDSSGFLVQGYSRDTNYLVSTLTLLKNLKNDFRKARPKKILELTKWTYTFVVNDRISETLDGKKGFYLYHRLRYNSFLTL